MDTYIKAVCGSIGAIISYVVGGLGMAFTVLFVLMLIDFATGMMAASVNEGLSSAVGRKGFIKKLYVLLLIGAVYLIEKAMGKTDGIVSDGVTIAYCAIEFISIVENGGKLGVPLGPVANIIAVLKGKSGNND